MIDFQQNRLFRFLSSVKLALPMLLILAALLATGTIVESLYSTAVAKRFVYGTWWFSAFLFLLGLNVLCSALSRLPWKKYHTGFVITHLGILCVLAGSFVTQRWGTDGQIALEEGESGSAFQESKPVLYCTIEGVGESAIAAGYPALGPGPRFPFIYEMGAGRRLKVDRFYLNARKVVTAQPVAPGQGGEAMDLSLNSSFVNENDWLFLGRPGMDEVDLGPASVYFKTEADWEKFMAGPGGRSVPENALVFLETATGIQVKVRHRGLWGPAEKVKWGGLTPTGWMDMGFEATQPLPSAVPLTTYLPAPLSPREDPRMALHFSVSDGADGGEGWLGFGDQLRLELGGKAWDLDYGPKRGRLPFTLELKKFDLGLDPGTQTPASYASDVVAGGEPYRISMNHPLHAGSYTVYQASYSALGGGKYLSVFAVGRDPGLVIKYAGALTMVLGIIFMFWFKNPAWKKKETNETPSDPPPAQP